MKHKTSEIRRLGPVMKPCRRRLLVLLQKLSSSIFSLKSSASYALHFQSKAGKNFVPIFTNADSTSVELSVRVTVGVFDEYSAN
ncbi:hypothetical protein T09_5194 [Trichinella sp. T9]|nr:hypothetical protein T09_5194 [Trichinella sp. T9]